MLNLSVKIDSLKKRIRETEERKEDALNKFDYTIAMVMQERLSGLNEMLDFCYNLLGD